MDTLRQLEIRETIQVALRELRAKLKLTQEAMAAQVGCTVSTLQKWERGVFPPAGDWLIKIIRLCPDEETRELFFKIGQESAEGSLGGAPAPGPDLKSEISNLKSPSAPGRPLRDDKRIKTPPKLPPRRRR